MDESTYSLNDGIFVLEDEEGTKYEFKAIASIEHNGVKYYAMVPADAEEYEEYVILKTETRDGEEGLTTIDDDDEFDDISDAFDDLFFDEVDYDEDNGQKK